MPMPSRHPFTPAFEPGSLFQCSNGKQEKSDLDAMPAPFHPSISVEGQTSKHAPVAPAAPTRGVAARKVGVAERRVLAVMDRLAGRDDALMPEAVHAAMVEDGHRYALSSVYRAMTKLSVAGVLERHDTAGGSVVFMRPQGTPRTAYLACQTCGKASGISDPVLRERLEAAARRLGFAAAHRAITLRGHCEACVKASWALRTQAMP